MILVWYLRSNTLVLVEYLDSSNLVCTDTWNERSKIGIWGFEPLLPYTLLPVEGQMSLIHGHNTWIDLNVILNSVLKFVICKYKEGIFTNKSQIQQTFQILSFSEKIYNSYLPPSAILSCDTNGSLTRLIWGETQKFYLIEDIRRRKKIMSI